MAKGGAHPLKFLDLGIQRRNPLVGKLTCKGTFVRCVERLQLADLLQREPGCLRPRP